jgi:hypothetical protein
MRVGTAVWIRIAILKVPSKKFIFCPLTPILGALNPKGVSIFLQNCGVRGRSQLI